MTIAVASCVTISPNSRTAPTFRLAVEVSPGTKCMLLQLAPTPWTNNRRAGMLVTKVPMNSQPKIRPLRVTSIPRVPRSAVPVVSPFARCASVVTVSSVGRHALEQHSDPGGLSRKGSKREWLDGASPARRLVVTGGCKGTIRHLPISPCSPRRTTHSASDFPA
jgi:hypothetical protein